MIAILGAMKEELDAFLETRIRTLETWKGFEVNLCRLADREVLVSRCGVGKVMASLVTQRIIDTYAPEAVVLCGIGGALNSGYAIGDMVIAEDCIQHDLSAEACGIPRGKVPLTRFRFLESSPRFVEAAKTWKPEGFAVHFGRILTGDQFITADMAPLTRELSGDAVDMEGAASALVCAVNGVPFFLVRVVSDRVLSPKRPNLRTMLSMASARSRDCISHVLSVVR